MCDAGTATPLAQDIRVLSGFAFASAGFNRLVGLPLIRIRDLARSDTEVRFKGRYDPAYLIKKDDILIGMDGDFEVHRWNGDVALLNQRVCKVEAATQHVDQRFLYWYLKPRVADIHRRTPQTTVRHLSARDVYLIPQPPIDAAEQSVVAQILDTLDAAIHETEAIIAKLEAVKQGLLHDLLTRGIDANGELRPPQPEAPHLYKASPLGWIPKEWDAKQLTELLGNVDPAMRSGPFGSALLKQELVEAGHPLLGIDNVHSERFVADYTRFVTPKKFAQLVRYAVRPHDLMITIMGTVGRCCLVPEDVGQALSSKHTWTISLDQRAYSPYLAMLQVNYSPWVLTHFARDQQGGTMAAIRSETLRSTWLPAPPRPEQHLIEERLRELSQRIDLEAASLSKRHSEKAGLMDDLLTGRVRVTPLLQEPQAA